MRFFLIWRDDSNDDSPGMPISISTISGRSSRAFSTASPPSEASPTTSKSLSLSSSRRTPWRNNVWSSTSKHLIFGMGEFLLPFNSACVRHLPPGPACVPKLAPAHLQAHLFRCAFLSLRRRPRGWCRPTSLPDPCFLPARNIPAVARAASESLSHHLPHSPVPASL